VLYLATSRASVVAEFYRLAERQGVSPDNLLPRQLVHYRVSLQRVLDLTNADNLDTAGLKPSDVRAEDPAMCQAVGAAAHLAGFEAILAPSATSVGETLAVFLHDLQLGSNIEPVGKRRWNRLPPH
jgi:RES domain-containing protein